jgi:hypothetical protein
MKLHSDGFPRTAWNRRWVDIKIQQIQIHFEICLNYKNERNIHPV